MKELPSSKATTLISASVEDAAAIQVRCFVIIVALIFFKLDLVLPEKTSYWSHPALTKSMLPMAMIVMTNSHSVPSVHRGCHLL